MTQTMKTAPKDHCWGSGRIDPDRLRRALLLHHRFEGGGLLAMVETSLLIVLLLATLRDASPIDTLRDIVAWTMGILRALATVLVSFM